MNFGAEGRIRGRTPRRRNGLRAGRRSDRVREELGLEHPQPHGDAVAGGGQVGAAPPRHRPIEVIAAQRIAVREAVARDRVGVRMNRAVGHNMAVFFRAFPCYMLAGKPKQRLVL